MLMTDEKVAVNATYYIILHSQKGVDYLGNCRYIYYCAMFLESCMLQILFVFIGVLIFEF